MEINKERTLAYKLANTLTPQDLSEISGGESQKGMTYKPTLVPTGNDPHHLDPVVDITLDW